MSSAVAYAAIIVIHFSTGGAMETFERDAQQIKANHELLVIDGYCASACMTMADLARPNVCITERAVFGYHKTNWGRYLPLSSDLRSWIVRHGGFPDFDSEPGLMLNQDALRYWRLCDGRM